ncbi:MAG: hypothetical protein ACI4O9_00375 [Akkermansia sp.]
MKSYTTLPNYTYCVSTVAGTTITTIRDGKTYTLLELPGACQGYFTAINDSVMVSDDDAVLIRLPKDAPIGVAGGGRTIPISLPAADTHVPLLHQHIYTAQQGEVESLDWSALALDAKIGTTAEIWLMTSENPPEIVWPQDWVWRGTCADDTPPVIPCAKLCVFLLRRDAVGVTARLADVRGEERSYVQPVMTGADSWSNSPSFGMKVSAFTPTGVDVSASKDANGNPMYVWNFFAASGRYTLFFPWNTFNNGYDAREMVMEFERPLKITMFRWGNYWTGSTGFFSYEILADDVIIINNRLHWHSGSSDLVDIPVPRLNQRYARKYTFRLLPVNSGWSSGRFNDGGRFKIVGVY